MWPSILGLGGFGLGLEDVMTARVHRSVVCLCLLEGLAESTGSGLHLATADISLDIAEAFLGPQ